MQTLSSAPSLCGRRLTGALLYALLVTAIAFPISIWLVGLVIGPQPLRDRVIITMAEYFGYHGRAGLYLVLAVTMAVLTLYNLTAGPQRRYGWNWGLGQQLFDDSLTAYEKLAVVLTSPWGCALLAIDIGWIILVMFAPN